MAYSPAGWGFINSLAWPQTLFTTHPAAIHSTYNILSVTNYDKEACVYINLFLLTKRLTTYVHLPTTAYYQRTFLDPRLIPQAHRNQSRLHIITGKVSLGTYRVKDGILMTCGCQNYISHTSFILPRCCGNVRLKEAIVCLRRAPPKG